jgi:hypothetical protein
MVVLRNSTVKTCGGKEVEVDIFLIVEVNVGKWSPSHSGCLILEERALCSHGIEGRKIEIVRIR